MNIKIFNGSDSQTVDTKKALNFSSSFLMSKRLVDRLEITVHFVQDLYLNYNIKGDCIWQDDNHRPREFSIRIDQNVNDEELYQTVFHEMVHVKQWATSKKRDYIRNSHLTKFDGILYDQRELSYSSKPWEIEAYETEDIIFEHWQKSVNSLESS